MRGTPPSSLSNHSCCGIIPAYAGNTRLAAWSAGCRGDHPRVCGEHVRNSIVSWCSSGSSPRMRGTRLATRPKTRSDGIIPAYAGNTSSSNRATVGTGDHPRVCGEHLTSCVMVVSSMGSSPRMRGTLVVAELLGHESGIIPAYAGNTWNRQRQASPCWDHPRVCGEHAVLNSDALPFTGSSPRMRGTLLHHALALASGGIIPAYAGNTCETCEGSSDGGDHPRVCGEHAMVSATALAVRGSSPRMRGTQSRCRPCMRRTGIIPAYAGNTRGGSNATADIRDHPRVCGEHTSRNSSRRRMTGSSPRMRGTCHRRSVRSLRAGIIPAYAGNTGWYVSRYAARRDHPRVCGEHEPLLLPKLRTLGSSPRMRGTPHPVGSGRPHPGIIPAYAGNTMAEL